MPETEPSAVEVYAATRLALVQRCRSLSPTEANTIVPLTPAWRIADVVAHVCGINADFVAGRLEGLGSDAWTARQVEKRRGSSLSAICDEWMRLAPELDALLEDDPGLAPRLLGDLIVHVHDIEHALGIEPDRVSAATAIGAPLRPAVAGTRRRPRGSGAGDRPGCCGTFEPGSASAVRLRTSAYDFLRAVTGRRSRAQVAAFDWQRDPDLVDRIIDGIDVVRPVAARRRVELTFSRRPGRQSWRGERTPRS
ncbi:MAG: hypothetical protein R2710_27660 [Acidimicrobiales bacterium]